MAYDESKDKEVKTWKHEKGLYVSLYQYNGGAPKVQIGPRGYTKADGSEGFGSRGQEGAGLMHLDRGPSGPRLFLCRNLPLR